MTIRPRSVTPLRIVLVFLAGLPPASAAELESGPPPNDGVVTSAFLGVGSTTEAGLFIGATFGLRVQRWGGRWAFGGDLGISDGTGSSGGAGRSWLPYFSSLSTAGTRVGHDRVAAFALVRASREIVPGWALSLGAGVEHRTLLEYTQSCTRASGLDDEICGDANTSWYTTAYGPVVDLSLGTTMFRHHLDASLHVQGRSDSALVFLEAAYGPVFRRKTHTEREAVMVLGEENGTFRSSVPLTSAGTWTSSGVHLSENSTYRIIVTTDIGSLVPDVGADPADVGAPAPGYPQGVVIARVRNRGWVVTEGIEIEEVAGELEFVVNEAPGVSIPPVRVWVYEL